jgi:hypothetical protein
LIERSLDMRITESRLRRIIRSVIIEADVNDPIYDRIEPNEFVEPNEFDDDFDDDFDEIVGPFGLSPEERKELIDQRKAVWGDDNGEVGGGGIPFRGRGPAGDERWLKDD